MTFPIISTYIFGIFIAVVVLFQFALIFGAPWGEMAMGGKFPGRLPVKIRIAAVMQIILLLLMAEVVFSHSGLVNDVNFGFFHMVFPDYAIWVVVALCLLSCVANTMTPSKKERALWAPVSTILLICVLVVALN
ncbi:hypothetical protein Q4575_06055 [Psychrosphaera sp. 1_MG-2023]|uniref:hypothetical protein n=1 Tax=Psychrosphaera sp. 1_MG-2023 TaxID=3062643 RepID=UPI0026E15E28|nr:hypothetical protein [Psychrosphaera sp. 1_MG-2023]MDO6718956.1 hypothetical protein [Psychrosphaera sp. 1_MG-2023]